MALYAIGDLHLSLGTNKPMDVFGPAGPTMFSGWRRRFPPGGGGRHRAVRDTSWGIDLSQSLEDFRFIDRLPGKKLLVKGNHDYWWSTAPRCGAFFRTTA